jgi:hypothetical protein
MKPTTRWIIAIVLAIILLALGSVTYAVGFGLGGMATDSCSNLPNSSFAYLEYFWPVVLLASGLVAPVLIIRQSKWRWVWLALGIGLVTSLGCYLLWYVYLMFAC